MLKENTSHLILKKQIKREKVGLKPKSLYMCISPKNRKTWQYAKQS